MAIAKINYNVDIEALCKDTSRYWNLEFKSLEFLLLIFEIASEIDFCY
jgi:hypothetical protein